MYLVKQGGKVDYNYKEYYLDTLSELSSIPVDDCATGSVAYIIATQQVFILNNQKEWKEQ